MRVLEDKEEERYSNFMDTVACTVFKESLKGVAELAMGDNDPREHTQEIGTAMGQVVLDEVIQLTKDMSREELVLYLAEISIGHAVGSMVAHPEYKHIIMSKLGLV